MMLQAGTVSVGLGYGQSLGHLRTFLLLLVDRDLVLATYSHM